MDVPLSWLKEYVRIDLSPAEIARRLTFAGLEVEAVDTLGVKRDRSASAAEESLMPPPSGARYGDLVWDREKIVVGEVLEVLPHPNADRLVLCRLGDGQAIHTVLTGAPNLFPYKGLGPLPSPLKVAYAREGAELYDGHQPGWVVTVLRRMKIRGVDSYSMICSEKELGISDEHEGVLILPEEAPTGKPLADYLGEVIFSIKINPNMARNASILGIARELGALTGRKARWPPLAYRAQGSSLKPELQIRIQRPDLNPRFTAALIRGVEIGPSPFWMQWRLQRAGMRPINNVVDITNYVMLEMGQPLHAFDWDVLIRRAEGGPVTIRTRLPKPDERLLTLDGQSRALDEFTLLVCDERGPLSIAGVMGGAESEVSNGTTNVLLEGASWDYLSIRRTVQAQKLPSEAAFRFSRGVHPAMTLRAVARAAELMRKFAGGTIARDIADVYPRKAPVVQVDLPLGEVARILGVSIPAAAVTRILKSLEFEVGPVRPRSRRGRTGRDRPPRSESSLPALRVTVPDHRLDIGREVVGQADLIEEIARIYGYERLPEAQMADSLPAQRGNLRLEQEERARDVLVALGLQEVVTYRLTTREREALFERGPAPAEDYITLANPIAPDRTVLRRSLLASLLEVAARNSIQRDSLQAFEVGPVFHPGKEDLPGEAVRLAILMYGPRQPLFWESGDRGPVDFYDLKGVVEAWAEALHLPELRFESERLPCFHPGKCAGILISQEKVGVLGELHPEVVERLGLPFQKVPGAEIDFDALRAFLPERYSLRPVTAFPPVLEDLAVIVPEDTPAERLIEVIRRAAGNLLHEVRIFDVYRGGQVGEGMKSLAFSLVYQAPDRTLTDAEAARVREEIIQALGKELGARLRGPTPERASPAS